MRIENKTFKHRYDTEGNEIPHDLFSSSKAVDDNGNLKVMWHGTTKGGFKDFDSNKGKSRFSGSSYLGNNVNYFTDDYKTALSYSENYDFDKKRVGIPDERGATNYKTYLDIQNPLIIDAKGSDYLSIEREGNRDIRKQRLLDFYNKYNKLRDNDLEDEDLRRELAYMGYELKPSDEEGFYDLHNISGGPFGSGISGSWLANVDDLLEYGLNLEDGFNPDDYINPKESTDDIVRDILINHPEYDSIVFKNINNGKQYFDGNPNSTTIVTLKNGKQIKII